MASEAKYKIGDKVRVKLEGKYYKAKIFSKDYAVGIGEVYLVDVDMGDKEVFVIRAASEILPIKKNC